MINYQKIVHLLALVLTLAIGQLNAQDAESLLALPSLTTAQMNAVVGAEVGSVIFNTDDNNFYGYNGTSCGKFWWRFRCCQ